jgi:aerobic-type carbon monoxide dehydrogenase small subunit (CoxS/CutS family)
MDYIWGRPSFLENVPMRDMRVPIEIEVNGRRHREAVSPGRTLLNFLREGLGLTGTKQGCDQGQCGACTVLLNGRPVNACLVLAVEADGKRVETIEGMAQDGTLHPLQEAFVEEGAVQCGFCTPGMILSAKALLDEKTSPTEEEIRVALSGNLCRCTGYVKIVAAVKRAAAALGKYKPDGSGWQVDGGEEDRTSNGECGAREETEPGDRKEPDGGR